MTGGRLVNSACGLVVMGAFWFLLSARGSEPAIAFLWPKATLQTTPAEVPVQLRIPKDATNRLARVSWDAAPCDDAFGLCEHDVCEAGAFDMQIEGTASPAILPRAPRLVVIRARCPYQFVADLFDDGGHFKGRATTQVRVQ